MKKLIFATLIILACSGNQAQDKQKTRSETENEWITRMKNEGQKRFEVTHIFDANTGFIVVCDKRYGEEYMLPFKGGATHIGNCRK